MPNQAEGIPLDVYAFRSSAFARHGDSVVCIGARKQLESLLGAGMLSATFFGYALYRASDETEYIGARNASKLRRLLRERGAQVTTHRHRVQEMRRASREHQRVFKPLPDEVPMQRDIKRRLKSWLDHYIDTNGLRKLDTEGEWFRVSTTVAQHAVDCVLNRLTPNTAAEEAVIMKAATLARV